MSLSNVDANFALEVIYPRPDSETLSTDRHRNAHTEMDFVIPIGVQFGKWPYTYEITTGPTGATIGQSLTQSGDHYIVSADYGKLTWPKANVATAGAGPHSFVIKVTDDAGNSIDVEFSTTVDDTAFIFQDVSAGGGGTGTFASPFNTFADWYGTTTTDNTYAGKILVLRAGSYDISITHTDVPANKNLIIEDGNKPVSYMAFPGESVTFNMNFTLDGAMVVKGTSTNVYVSGIDHVGSNETDSATNAFIWYCQTTQSRSTWFECTFDTPITGTNATNEGCVYYDSSANHPEYIYMVRCTGTDLPESSGGATHGFSIFESYCVNRVLIEHCSGTKATGQRGAVLYLKADTRNADVRNCYLENDSDRSGAGAAYECYGQVDHVGSETENIEFRFNRVIIGQISAGTDVGQVIRLNLSTESGSSGSQFVYRNTFVGYMNLLTPNGNEYSGYNVVQSSTSPQVDADFIDITDQLGTDSTSIQVTSADSALDANYDLQDGGTEDYRTAYLGINGNEIAGTAPEPPEPEPEPAIVESGGWAPVRKKRKKRDDDGRQYQMAWNALNRRGRQLTREDLAGPVQEAVEETVKQAIELEVKQKRPRPDYAKRKFRDLLLGLKQQELADSQLQAKEFTDVLVTEYKEQAEEIDRWEEDVEAILLILASY